MTFDISATMKEIITVRESLNEIFNYKSQINLH